MSDSQAGAVTGIIDRNTVVLAVEGYPGRLSYAAGDTVELHCSSSASTFSVEVVRAGARPEVVHRAEGVAADEHPVPPDAYAVGAGWPVAHRIRTDPSWRSGAYLVTLRADGVDGPEAESHALFAIRPGGPATRLGDDRILLVLATNTYNAYNKWGGACLYTGATRVSFRRPIERGFLVRPDADFDGRVASTEPGGDPGHRRLLAYLEAGRYPMWCASSGFHNWERRFLRWAEGAGFQVDVAVNSDLEERPEVLDGVKLVVSVGHDEYWSWAMRDTLDAFVNAGGNHAIFSGNTSFWQVRLEDGGDTMVCFKGGAAADPVLGTDREHLLTSCWSDPRIGRPETSTIGLTFSRGGYARIGRGTPRSSGAFTVYRPDHWAFDGTGLCYGDALGLGSYVVGYETDGCAFTLEHGLPVPTHEDGAPEGMEILATAPARLLSQTDTYSEIPAALWADPTGPGDLEGVATMLFGSAAPEHTARIAHNSSVVASFRRGAGTVFNAGTTDWAYGLDSDATVRRVTANVLTRLSARGG